MFILKRALLLIFLMSNAYGGEYFEIPLTQEKKEHGSTYCGYNVDWLLEDIYTYGDRVPDEFFIIDSDQLDGFSIPQQSLTLGNYYEISYGKRYSGEDFECPKSRSAVHLFRNPSAIWSGHTLSVGDSGGGDGNGFFSCTYSKTINEGKVEQVFLPTKIELPFGLVHNKWFFKDGKIQLKLLYNRRIGAANSCYDFSPVVDVLN